MSKGYELADGSLSTEYKLGDNFVIVDGEDSCYTEKLVLYRDDKSGYPYFRIGHEVVSKSWFKLNPIKDFVGNYNKQDVNPPTEKEKYIIVRAGTTGNTRHATLDYLQEQVNDRIKEGYATTGGLTMMEGVILQPMVLQEGNIIE